MINLLFTCAGRRTYLLKYFHDQLNGEGLIFGGDMQLSAPALSVADVKIQLPSVYHENYIETLLDICQKNDIKCIISLNDLELPILAESKHLFADKGIQVLVSSQDVIEICFDKFNTAKFITHLGLNTPATYININEAKGALSTGKLSFPIILKPRWGSGSIGIEIVNSLEELDRAHSMLLKKIKASILAKASADNNYILFQQFLKGQEYGLDVMNDLNGAFRAVSVKRKLAMRAGETDKACTVDNPDIREIGSILGSKLHHIGNLDVDVFETDGKYYVLELNPRFGGGFPFSYEAGVNFPKAIIEWLKGNEIDDSILIPEYGRTFAKCDYLVEV